MNNIIPNVTTIRQLIKDCSVEPEVDAPGVKTVEGVVRVFFFDQDKLDEHKEEILLQIASLPEQFSEGWSFLNACMNRDGAQWGEHRDMEELMVLGIAIDKIVYCLPRQFWSALPGGMPYFQVK